MASNIEQSHLLREAEPRQSKALVEFKMDLIKWMVGTAIFAVGIGLTGFYFILSHFKR